MLTGNNNCFNFFLWKIKVVMKTENNAKTVENDNHTKNEYPAPTNSFRILLPLIILSI